MGYPKHLKYTKDHEWVNIEGSIATIGVTTYAIEQWGDIVYLELPHTGEHFKPADAFGSVESTKTVSDIYMPVGGTVLKINADLKLNPKTLQTDAYNQGWLIQVQVDALPSTLLTADQYETYLSGHEN
jgi:glycine cleavage system H protein